MPMTVTVRALGAWFCVGLCMGSGWALGGWIVARLLMRL